MISYNELFSYENLYNSALKCFRNVGWKTLVIKFKTNLIMNVYELYDELQNKSYKPTKQKTFFLKERGKIREIRPSHIRDRVVQKCLCENYLIPTLQKSLIYDNGACIKGKGLKFTLDRIKAHLQKYKRINNSNHGYILTFDIRKFFDSIDKQILLAQIKQKIKNQEIISLIEMMLSGSKGLSLGNELSQTMALFYLNSFDHFIKENLHQKFYGRYMDDGYIISDSKEELVNILNQLDEYLKTNLHLELNRKKTRIYKLEKGFVILKRHWLLKSSGFVVIKPVRESFYRLKHKYKKLKKWNNKLILDRFLASVNSYLSNFNSFLLKIKFFK